MFWLLSLLFFQIKGPRIGLLGISLGADICLSMASFLKNISATVSINGSGFSGHRVVYYKGHQHSTTGPWPERVKVAFSGLLDIVDIRNDIIGGCENPCMIPIEKAQGPILFIVGQDDHNWRSELYAQIASEHRPMERKNPDHLLSWDWAHWASLFPHVPSFFAQIIGQTRNVGWGAQGPF